MIPGINQTNPRQNTLFNLGYYILFGLLFFLILTFVYDPELLYFELQPFFAFDASYFDFYHNMHNGLLIILSQFFLQFLIKPVFGSILLVLLLLALALIIKSLSDINKAKYLKGIEFIPSIIILISLKNYSLGIETLMLLIIAASLLLITKIIPDRYSFIKPVYYLIALMLAFFMFGMMTAIAYIAFAIVFELLHTQKLHKYLSITICIIALAFLIYKITGLSIAKTILWTANDAKYHAIMPLYWHTIIITILVLLISYLLSKTQFIDRLFIRFPAFLIQSMTIAVFLIIGFVFYKSLLINPKKYNSQIEFFANKNQWRKVLAFRNKVTIDDRISIFELNRALYHEGIMMEKLFAIPQYWGVHTLFLTIQFDRECAINSSDLYYDMGFVKGAQYWALEAQTYNPYAPRILQRFVQCALVLGDKQIAKKYLAVLNHSPIYRKWAKNMLLKYDEKDTDYIKKDLIGNVEINYDIFFINSREPNLDLIQILQKDSSNRMAAEYLLSYYLLECKLGSVEHFIQLYGGYNRDNLPTIYQEAMLMRQLMKKIPENEFAFSISKEVKNKMAKFNKIIIEYNFEEKKAKKDLFRLYGDSFWYYFRYLSPLTTGSSIKTRDK